MAFFLSSALSFTLNEVIKLITESLSVSLSTIQDMESQVKQFNKEIVKLIGQNLNKEKIKNRPRTS